jgi:hypothetical protein
MRDAFGLFVIVGKATLIVAGGFCALMLTLFLFGLKLDEQKSTWIELLALVVTVLLPIAVASGWMFRKLRTVYPRREARAVSTAFGLFTPVSLCVSMLVGEITGGYAQILVGPMFFGLIGALVGAVAMTAFLSFLICASVLRVTRLAISVEQSD